MNYYFTCTANRSFQYFQWLIPKNEATRSNVLMLAPKQVVPSLFSNSRIFISQTQIQSEINAAHEALKLVQTYDCKFCVAVVGSLNSGKETILGKECDFAIVVSDTRIEILTKAYKIQGLTVMVEYWCAPESQKWSSFTARCISGLAGTLFFFDGNIDFIKWRMKPQSNKWNIGWNWWEAETEKTEVKILWDMFKHWLRTRLMYPVSESFCMRTQSRSQVNMEWNILRLGGISLISPSDDLNSVNDIFRDFLTQIVKRVPDKIDRTKKKLPDQYKCPIGLQLSQALEPAIKYQYREKLKATQPTLVGTTVVDWLVSPHISFQPETSTFWIHKDFQVLFWN